MIHRLLNPSESQSILLFGARGTGKTTFLNHFLKDKDHVVIDLLQPDMEERYSRHPNELYEEFSSKNKRPKWIFIDEVQKAPSLLNLAHKMIEEFGQKFVLTGSSARKLKRGKANLLAGRAFVYNLFPFSHIELGAGFELNSYLQWGGLPRLYSLPDEKDKILFLKTYANTFLKEEIKEEQLVRRINPFRDFLEISAQMSGKVINFSKIAKEIHADAKTVINYFSILEDTLLGFYLPAFHQSVRKRQRQSPKFYLFDLGVKNFLEGIIEIRPKESSGIYGHLFENFIITEVFKLNEYTQKNYSFSYLSSQHGMEIDLILTKGKMNLAVEIKSSDQIDEVEVRKLEAIGTDIPNIKKIYYVSRNKSSLLKGKVHCIHWTDFFKEVFFNK